MDRLLRMRFSTVLAALGFLSLIVNFAAQWRTPHAVDFSSEAARVSFAILHGRGFSDPYLTGPSGPTAQMAPLYPFFHAAICSVFGVDAAGWFAIVAITSLAWAFECAYAYRIASAFGQAIPGLAAAMLGAMLPLQGRFFKWEGVFTGAALAFCTWEMTQLLAGHGGRWRGLRLGMGLAAAVLLCPSSVLIWPAWGLFCLYKMGFRRALGIFTPVFLLALIPIALWTVRNYREFGKIFFIRDDMGLVLVSSYSDCATALLSENLASGCYLHEHPSANVAMLDKLRVAGEFDFFASESRRTRSWIAAHPVRAAELTVEHAIYFWFPLDRIDKVTLLYGIIFSALTILSFGSLFWKSDAVPILLLALIPFSLTYYTAQFEQRYRYPVLWISGLLASVGVKLIFERLRRQPARMSF